MRVVFMGTPDFAVATLNALAQSGHEVVACVTQADKPVGRKAVLTPPPVKQRAAEFGIPVLQPAKMKDPAFFEELRAYSPDVIAVAAFGRIVPESILELPRYGCLNVHASLLPKYRGAAPIQWAIIDGEEVTGVTIMQMDAGLDTGDMLLKREITIAPDETGGSLFEKLAGLGGDLLVEALDLLGTGELKGEPQPAESPTAYARMIKKEDGRINWTMPAEEIERRVRAFDPWPGAWTKLNGKILKIWKVRLNDGGLELLEVQLEGKKRMPMSEFLKGNPIEPGTVFD